MEGAEATPRSLARGAEWMVMLFMDFQRLKKESRRGLRRELRGLVGNMQLWCFLRDGQMNIWDTRTGLDMEPQISK